MEDFFVDILLPLGRIMVYVTAALAIVSAVMGSLNDPKGAMKGVLGMLALAALVFITYSIASPEHLSDNVVSDGISKLVEGSLMSVILLTVVTVVLMFGSMIKDMFN